MNTAHRYILISTALLLLLAGCESKHNNQQLISAPTGANLLFTTTAEKPPCKDSQGQGCVYFNLPFASDRNDMTDTWRLPELPALEYGEVSVAVPKGVRYGQSAQERHFQDTHELDPDSLTNVGTPGPLTWEQFKQAVAASITPNSKGATLLYVHGYADQFEDAARRTAILEYELGWDGAALFYTWPSQGHFMPITNYIKDEASVDWTEPHLADFLKKFLAEVPTASKVIIIAHSMGTRAVTRAVVDVATANPHLTAHIAHLFLFAGDMDQGVFQEQILPVLVANHIPVTLYGSSQDIAISQVSPDSAPRIGDGGDHRALYRGITTVDASNVDLSSLPLGLFGHAYLVESDVVVHDLYDWIDNAPTPLWRVPAMTTGANPIHYWVLKKTDSP